MNKFKITLFLFVLILGCKNKKEDNSDYIIKDDMILEFRMNFDIDKGKLELIDKTSPKFENLKSFFKLSNDFKEVNEIKNYPLCTLISDDLVILINYEQIHLEFKNPDGKIVKLTKSVDALKEFDYLLLGSNKWITDYGNFYGSGNLKNDTYLKCGLTSKEVDYFYKVGYWKFWGLNRKLIAEGEFETDSIRTTIKGVNCENVIKISKINKANWKFYDDDDEVKPSVNLIYLLENAEKKIRQ